MHPCLLACILKEPLVDAKDRIYYVMRFNDKKSVHEYLKHPSGDPIILAKVTYVHLKSFEMFLEELRIVVSKMFCRNWNVTTRNRENEIFLCFLS